MHMVHWGPFSTSLLELLRMNIIIINFFWAFPLKNIQLRTVFTQMVGKDYHSEVPYSEYIEKKVSSLCCLSCECSTKDFQNAK